MVERQILKYARLIKIQSDEKHLVSGVVYSPKILDAHDDYADAGAIEEAAHQYMIDSRVIKVMHEGENRSDIAIVESYVAPMDIVFKKNTEPVPAGSWIITVKVFNDDLWAKVKSYELTGFSMGGIAEVEEE